MFDAHMARTLPEGIDVLAIDLDCRRSAPEVAARANADAWQALRQPGRRLYKKIDSTLRGNFAAEVAALVPWPVWRSWPRRSPQRGAQRAMPASGFMAQQ